MKNIILLFVFFLCAITTTAQVPSTYFESKDAFNSFPVLRYSKVQELTTKRMLPIDAERLLKEDSEAEGMNIPYRFGYVFDVNYTMKDGMWEDRGTEERIWSLKIKSPGAYSLNFIFDKLHLAVGAKLHIFNTEGSMVYGPVTEEQNLTDGIFLTDLVVGDEVIIQISEPAISRKNSVIKITRVVHAYKNVFPFDSGSNTKAADYNCHNDVACHSAWSQESDGVVFITLINGKNSYTFTGSLLNNTAQDYRPYILTAFHCIDSENTPNCNDGVLNANEIANAENSTFRFQYKKTTCNGSSINSTFTYNRAYLRAYWRDTDFALMELRENIHFSYFNRISFLGWDRSGNVPTIGTVIHHPKGEPMKISFDNHSLVMNSSAIPWDCNYSLPANTHWIVGLDNGTSESGSSGAPLFDTNKRVIGQNHGGPSGCPPITKYFGSLQYSWDRVGSNSTNRLRDWLDPLGTGDMTTNTVRHPVISGPTLICTSGSFTASNWQSGYYWDKSNNLINLSSPATNSSITASAASNSSSGMCTVSVKYNNGATMATYNVWVGKPAFQSSQIIGNRYPCVNEYNAYQLPLSYIPHLAQPTRYEWTTNYGTIDYPYYHYCNATYSNSGYAALCLKITNACGSFMDCIQLNPQWCSPFKAFPNPVSNVLTIEMDQNASTQTATGQTTTGDKVIKFGKTYDIRLYDGQGNLLRQTSNKGGTTQFNVSNLPNGIYYLHVYDGVNAQPEVQRIIVER